ncbi:MAG: S-layer homology domain-containing protein [Bryobacterales bacterium]|nr:S-layer homology domain-containing protein [Bryobacterales bacterium]
MLRFCISFCGIAVFAATSAAAQSMAGSTSITAVFSATAPPPSNVGQPPPRVLRGHPVIPLEQYQQYKAQLARRPVPIGPAALESSNAPGMLRAPGVGMQPLALTPTTSFEGITQTNFSPPDPDMASGPEDLIQVVNSSIARYTKTGEQTNAMTLQQWYSSLLNTVCPTGSIYCRIYDPTIRYDALHGRFLLSAQSEDAATAVTYFLISVSNGSTYAGGWRHWALKASLNGTTETPLELDYPMLGYDTQAVYLTGNMFDALGDLVYAKLRILKKSELYNPTTTTLTYRDIVNLKNEDGTTAKSLRPAELRGRPGDATDPGIMVNVAVEVVQADYMTLWRIQNPVSNNPTAVRTTLKNLWKYDFPAPIQQKDSVVRVDTGDSRVLRAILRNGVVYTARQTGYTDQPTTVTYDRIDLALNKVTLQTRLVNGGYMFPAFEVPASHGPVNAIPNRLIVGANIDASGALTYLGIPDVKAGEDKFELSSGVSVRWGDFFGASIDPVRGGLWTFGEYSKTRGQVSGRWGTWAAYFPWITTQEFTDVSSSNSFFDFVNVMKLWSITTGCTPTTYCPGESVKRGQMAVFLIRSMLGDNFTFPQTPYFTDVPATHTFFKYIQKMRELGITSGCTATTYCPDNNVTRGEMAVFLTRGKMRALLGDDFSFPTQSYFTDVPSSHPYHKFIQKLRELGVTSGCTATTYCPDAVVTREQMAAFVVRSFLN